MYFFCGVLWTHLAVAFLFETVVETVVNSDMDLWCGSRDPRNKKKNRFHPLGATNFIADI